jgi:hypothetical protein
MLYCQGGENGALDEESRLETCQSLRLRSFRAFETNKSRSCPQDDNSSVAGNVSGCHEKRPDVAHRFLQPFLHLPLPLFEVVFLLHLRPGVFQRDRAIENRLAGSRIRIHAKISEALELESLAGFRLRK